MEEIFEARPPKGKAILCGADGIISDIEDAGSLKIVKIKPDVVSKSKSKKDKVMEYPVPRSTLLFVKVGDEVKKGQKLSEGNIDLRELMEMKGMEEVIRYITGEVQKVYLTNGSAVNPKHIEVIVRQMFSRVQIRDAGDTEFVIGDVIPKSKFLEENRRVRKDGGKPARAIQKLLGITRVALTTESFLSAASFQDTARVLVKAAVEGKQDNLRGWKESVILGRLLEGRPKDEDSEEATKDEDSMVELSGAKSVGVAAGEIEGEGESPDEGSSDHSEE